MEKIKAFFLRHWLKILIVFLIFLCFIYPLWYLSNMEENTRRYITAMNVASMPWMIIQTMIFVGFLYLLQYGGGFSRFKKLNIKPGTGKVTFSDIIGLTQAKREAWEVVELIKDRKKLNSIGGKILKGVLLIGPPGCGKTMLAKAVAGEAGIPFISVSGSEFVEVYVGVGAARVRKLFKEARALAKEKGACIVFIDELEVIGRRRILYDAFGGGSETNSTQNQLLVEMDGLNDSDANVIVFGATNAVKDILDEALLRPGRFDRKIFIDRPNLEEREKIFSYYLGKIKYDSSVDIARLARKAVWKSPAEIENIVKEAALIAARHKRDSVTMKDMTAAIERIEIGFAHKLSMTPREREMTAWHEVGHLMALYLTHPTKDVFKVSILNRGGILGVVHSSPREELYSFDRETLLANIRVALGGYVAEKLRYNVTSDGVSSDFANVMSIAHDMVWRLGMGDGFIGDYTLIAKGYLSEELKENLNLQVKAIIDLEYKKTESIIKENWQVASALVELLLEKEELDYDEISEVFSSYGLKPYSMKQ